MSGAAASGRRFMPVRDAVKRRLWPKDGRNGAMETKLNSKSDRRL